MALWTLDADGWIYHKGRNVARVVTTPEDAGALVDAANHYPAVLAAARAARWPTSENAKQPPGIRLILVVNRGVGRPAGSSRISDRDRIGAFLGLDHGRPFRYGPAETTYHPVQPPA